MENKVAVTRTVIIDGAVGLDSVQRTPNNARNQRKRILDKVCTKRGSWECSSPF